MNNVENVSDDIIAYRINICNLCSEKTITLGVSRCKVCHCIIQLKTKLTNSNCPINKW